MSREICRQEERHNLFPLECRLSAGKNISHKNHVVYKKLEHIDDVIFRELVFGVRVFRHAVCFFVTQNLVFVSAVADFENEGVLINTSGSAFQVIVRNSCIKGRKSNSSYNYLKPRKRLYHWNTCIKYMQDRAQWSFDICRYRNISGIFVDVESCGILSMFMSGKLLHVFHV